MVAAGNSRQGTKLKTGNASRVDNRQMNLISTNQRMLQCPLHSRLPSGALALYCSLAASLFGSTLKARADAVTNIVGPNACAECHTAEADAWMKTHHHKTFREMPRSKAARSIANKLKIRRIKADSLCKGCHFTAQDIRNKIRVTAGISCESCHGAGKEWIKAHSEFSGKGNKQAETSAEAAARWRTSEARGMIRPGTLYELARNCYRCHVVPNERLVNVGGHTAGSPFELVSWSQGEVRHNLWYSKGKSNPAAGPERRRMMYLVGIAVELETAMRAVGLATKPKPYAIKMAHRANRARNRMTAIAKSVPGVPELREIVLLGHSAGLKLNNNAALSLAADKIAVQIKHIVAARKGTALEALDKFIPGEDEYQGTPAK